ncbi:DUF397 domain-containing protein [Streptomyces sp. NRRL F-4489]|nr:DUF397 domain-containing protein [Streptomyces sp. NRRL F-4489]
MRDSKTPGGPVLTLTPQSFNDLVTFAKTHG